MAQVVVTMESDVAKLIRDQERVIKRQEEMIAKFKQTGAAAKGAGDKAEQGGKQAQQAFGPRLAGMITTAISQFAGVTTAINLVTDALRFMREETERAKASFDNLADARRRLTQVATSAADLQQLEDRADELAARFGVDRNIVRQVIFSARSEGFEDVVDEIIASARVVAPEAAAGVAGQIPALFTDADLSPIEALNATLVAAQQSRLDFESVARALPGAAEGAAQAGASPAETFALASVLASRFKSGETAADRIKAFGTFVSLQPELAGRGILEAVTALQAMPETERRGMLGTGQELNVAFNVIAQEMDAIRERQRQVESAISSAGSEASAFARGRAAAFDPSTRAGQLNRASQEAERARIEREIAAERAAAGEGFSRQAAIDRAVGALQAQDDMAGAFAAQRAGEVASFVGLSPELTERASVSAANPEVPLLVRYGLPGLVVGIVRAVTGQNQVEDLRRPIDPSVRPDAGRQPPEQSRPTAPPPIDPRLRGTIFDPEFHTGAARLNEAAAKLDRAADKLTRPAAPPRAPAFAPRQRQQTAGNQE